MHKQDRGWAGIVLGLFLALGVCLWSGHALVHSGTPAYAAEEAVSGATHGPAVKSDVNKATETKAVHEEGEERGIHITHGQIMDFIWRCLNFGLLVIILVKFGKEPVQNFLKGHRESIQNEFDELEAQRREAQQKYEEYSKKLAGMDEEAERILQTFIKQGEAEKEKIIAQAQDAAERIKAQAKFYVQQELDKAREQLKSEVSNMAISMAEELIKKNITEQDHQRLIAEYLERVVQKN